MPKEDNTTASVFSFKGTVYLPTTPDDMTVKIGSTIYVMPIQDFTEQDLRAIGEEWTEKLIEQAKKPKLTTR